MVAGVGVLQFVKDDFDAFLECAVLGHCSLALRCGEKRIIAFITDASTIRDILVHLGEPTVPPRIAPA